MRVPHARFVLFWALAAVFPTASAQADVFLWSFPIAADQVRNGPEPDGTTDSQATGRGSFRYDSLSQTLDYTISWNDLESNITKLHVHGAIGAEASTPDHLLEVFNSQQDAIDAGAGLVTGTVSGSFSVAKLAGPCDPETPAVLPCLMENLAYVNVHTELLPVGEIRGNVILLPPLIVWDVTHSESQVRNGSEPDGSTDSIATGRASFRYHVDSERMDYTISWEDLEGDLTKLHIHGPAGPDVSNTNHLLEIFNAKQDVIDAGAGLRTGFVSGSFDVGNALPGCDAATPDTLACMLEDLAYVNVHTEMFPSGEIRGNTGRLAHPYAWEFPISEDQIRNGPEVDGSSDSVGTGHGTLTYDAFTGRLDYALSWDALEGDLTKFHIHGPAAADESNTNHLYEIFNSIQDVLDAGLDLRSDTAVGAFITAPDAVECTDLDPLPCLFEELAYVNVHTEMFPSGEIRGNVKLVPEPVPSALGAVALLSVVGVARRVRRGRSLR